MVVLVASVVLIPRSEVAACSCAATSARAGLREAEGAFIGRVESREEHPPAVGGGEGVAAGYPVTLRFRVERALKGSGIRDGGTVNVHTDADGGACGIGDLGARRVGLLLYRLDGAWHGGLCGTADPDELLRAGLRPPPPDGEGALRYLVAADLTDAQLVGLDANGRVLAYGAGPGAVAAIGVCPGGSRSVEMVWPLPPSTDATLVVRDLPSLAVVRATPVVGEGVLAALLCPVSDAAEVVWANSDYREPIAGGHVYRTTPTATEVVWEGPLRHITLSHDGRHAVVSTGLEPGTAFTLAVATRARGREVVVPPYVGPLAGRGDGRLAAGVSFSGSYDDHARSLAVLVDFASGVVRTSPLGSGDALGHAFWLDTGDLLIAGNEGVARIYDRRLRVQRTFAVPSFNFDNGVVADGKLVTLVDDLVAVDLATGRSTVVHDFDFQVARTFAVIDPPSGAPPLPASTNRAPATRAAVVALVLAAVLAVGVRLRGAAASTPVGWPRGDGVRDAPELTRSG